jgi:hypothetical protein
VLVLQRHRNIFEIGWIIDNNNIMMSGEVLSLLSLPLSVRYLSRERGPSTYFR